MAFSDFLTQTATIQEYTETNQGGVSKKTWSDKYTDIPARLSVNRGSMKSGAEGIEKYTNAEFTLYLQPNYGITERMKAVVDGEEYDIILVSKVRAKSEVNHLELQLNKIIK
jgi:hypothetical protein